MSGNPGDATSASKTSGQRATSANVDLERVLAEWTSTAIRELFPDLATEVDPAVRPSKFADYQVNCPLQLGKKLGRAPRDIATELAEEIKAQAGDALEVVEPSGPGFLNCTFSNEFLSEMLNVQRHDAALGRVVSAAPRRYVVDYGGPNVAKEMHVGHIRTTLIGDCIVRIL